MLWEGCEALIAKREVRIAGVFTIDLKVFGDGRGHSAELFRTEWFPERDWGQVQCNRSHSQAGALRALHFHHRQADYWHCLSGTMRIGLYDLRRQSPTHGLADVLVLSGDDFSSLFIPPGVAHGYYAVTDVALLYVVDRFYDGSDEFGVAWNDPDVGIDWGIEPGTPPIVSERDDNNPRLRDLGDDLP